MRRLARGRGRTLMAHLFVAWASIVAAHAGTVRVGVVVDAPEIAVGRRGRDLIVTSGEGDGERARPQVGVLRFAARARAGAPAPPSRYVVRIWTEKDRRKAELVEQGLRSALKVPLKVEKGSKGWTVVTAPLDSERKAEAIREQLHLAGMKDSSIVEIESEKQDAEPGWDLIAIDGDFDVAEVASGRARILPANGEPLEVDGTPYRGVIEVFVGGNGLLSVVDEVDLEAYVRGVLPEEMGPEVYPMPAALEAQAIAARTYVLRARQHPDAGFDACATAHCQVYGGASAEHPISDAAVLRTAGQILAFEGRPALTYFSSTCGGATEDVADVFTGQSEPYLRGVTCYPEQVGFRRLGGRKIVADWHLVSGEAADETLARLVVAGVVSWEEAQTAGFGRRATLKESSEWLRLALLAGGSRPRAGEAGATSLNVDTAITFLRSLVREFGWDEQRRLITSQDLAAAQRFRVLEGLTGEDLAQALIALKGGIVPLGFESGWATSRISRGNVLEVLALWLAGRGRFDVAPMRFLGGQDGGIRVLAGKEVTTVPLAGRPILLAGRRGAPPRVRDALDLKVGDKLWIQRDASGVASLVVLEDDPDGAAFDRMSAYSWWTRRIPAEQLARAAESKTGLKALADIRVTRVSPGGRIVGLDLIGAGGGPGETRSLAGFAVREVLGVPDLRAGLQVERDASGRLVAVVVTGRGWGHGVGLCQTGAHGMALAGATSPDILAHYYPGTTLSQAP